MKLAQNLFKTSFLTMFLTSLQTFGPVTRSTTSLLKKSVTC